MNVIITGSSKGIGRAIAEKFAAAGHMLFLCARNRAQLESAAIQIRNEYGTEVKVFPADLSLRESVASFGSWCLQHTVPDILINNAGVYMAGNISDEPDGQLEKMMELNLYSAYHLTRMLLPSMKEKKQGHIFNICSVASLKEYNGGGGYSISKFALNGFNKNLRHELKNCGIKVTAVFPGAVLTESWGNFDNSNNRIMEAKDIADLVYTAATLSPQAVVDEIIVNPQLGEL